MGLISRDDGWRMPDWLWQRVEPLLPARPEHPLGCHNPRVPDRAAMDAILVVLRTGMQWNALNATGVCHSSSAHRRFQEWEQAGVFTRSGARGCWTTTRRWALTGPGWRPMGRSPRPRSAGRRPGRIPPTERKRGEALAPHRGCGHPGRDAHEGAQRHDLKLLAPTIESIPIERPRPTPQRPQGLRLDRAYAVPPIRELATEHGFTPHIRTRGEEIRLKAQTPGWRARRWVVERTHSWLNRNRAILIRWSKKDENHLALLQLAAGVIAFRQAHAAGLPR
jgi:putative transposase